MNRFESVDLLHAVVAVLWIFINQSSIVLNPLGLPGASIIPGAVHPGLIAGQSQCHTQIHIYGQVTCFWHVGGSRNNQRKPHVAGIQTQMLITLRQMCKLLVHHAALLKKKLRPNFVSKSS